jgi:hypothetical protein
MPPADSGDTSPAAAPDARRAAEVEDAGQPALERGEVWRRGPARGESHLHDAAVARHCPADVAGREAAVEEAVQALGIDAAHVAPLALGAGQERGVAAQAERCRDGGARAVGAH